jgi:hypothetical protein
MCGAMDPIYIPPGHLWLIEMAVLIAQKTNPALWTPEAMLSGEREYWERIITERNLEEAVSDNLRWKYPDVDWTKTTTETCRLHTYDQVLQTFRILIAEGEIKARFVDQNNGQIEHIDGSYLRTDDGFNVVVRGCIYFKPGKPTYLFLSKKEVVDAFRQVEAPKHISFDGLAPLSKFDAKPTPQHTFTQKKEPTRKRRSNFEQSDPTFAQGLRAMRAHINRLKANGILPPSTLALAKMLAAEPDLRARVGDYETIRKILVGKNARANRVAEEGLAEPWWPLKRG